MHKITFLLVLIFFAVCCEQSKNSSSDQGTDLELIYQPFPEGYQYMEKSETLKKAVQEGNHKVVREHGWYLWAGIMQPADGLDWPIWYTWPNTKAAFESSDKNSLLIKTKPGEQTKSLLMHNISNMIKDTLRKFLPIYPIPKQVERKIIGDGSHFLFNEDILIPTESLSLEAMDWIRNKKLYKKETLDKLHNKKVASIKAPESYVVTKHMYWPVKASGLSAIPVWRNDFDSSYQDYAGYEKWKNLIAIDPSDERVGETVEVTYLHNVLEWDSTAIEPITKLAKVYSLEDFYYHKVTPSDWENFDENDKAIINASSYWAYDKPFVPGDYLVTIAMHINTKEIPTWALQSVWWSDQPDSGPEAADRPTIAGAIGPLGTLQTH